MAEVFKIALCQMLVNEDKQANIAKAVEMVKRAAFNGASLAILPEMFNCPYENSKFPIYAESLENSPTLESLSKAASDSNIFVVAGSIPERKEGKLYNTSVVFDNKGKILGTHRKMHLFDIDVPGRIRFKESEVLAAGNDITVVDTPMCGIGVAICYDIRFPELMRLMALNGAYLAVLPAAFNMVTGPAHWEMLIRARAVDNQLYVAAVSPARNLHASYTAYGNSMVSDPWGKVIAKANEGEEIVYADIDPQKVHQVRNELPLLKNRRTDVY